MKRGSIIGPVLLIVIGTLFLFHNLAPNLPILEMIGRWWPLILIGWGVMRIAEITSWNASGRPLPQNGLSGGEWTFIVFLWVIGSGVFAAHNFRGNWPTRIGVGGLEVLGESHDFVYSEQKLPGAGKTPRVLIENMRGDTRVMASDTEEVRASGRLSVRAFQLADAEKAKEQCKLEVVRQGDLIVIRSNQDRAGNSTKVDADLEVTVPRGASVEMRGRYGDWEVGDIAGSVTVDSENAGVRITNAGGPVRVATRASDIVRVTNAKSSVELTGRGEDVELDNVAGQATINGSYRGEITLRNLAKPVRVDDPRGELRCERIPGSVSMSRGEVSGDDIVGPIIVRGQSKDVALANFSESLEVSVERGDLDIRPNRATIGRMDLKTRAGNVTLTVPSSARFNLEGETEQGDTDNSYGEPLRTDRSGRGGKIEGKVGAGPDVKLHTKRGTVSVSKDDSPAPPAPPSPAAQPAPPAPRAPVATPPVPPKVESL